MLHRASGRNVSVRSSSTFLPAFRSFRNMIFCRMYRAYLPRQGDLPPLAENEEVLAFIDKVGVDQVALDGGFVAPVIDGALLGSRPSAAAAPLVASA